MGRCQGVEHFFQFEQFAGLTSSCVLPTNSHSSALWGWYALVLLTRFCDLMTKQTLLECFTAVEFLESEELEQLTRVTFSSTY
jgi:hypothetical protein